MTIRVEDSGNWSKTHLFLDRMIHLKPPSKLHSLAQRGVDALESATPRESGVTAGSWSYEILQNGSQITIWWSNDHVVDGFNVAIGLQYGHGTDGGSWIQGLDYINPNLRPVFDEISNAVWEEVRRS